MLVKKTNGKWRLCSDFTDINKACPKDSFPLPRIDLIVDATAGHELLSFMDAFSGYNQISMDPNDQEKTSFVTAQGTYCYQVMPFGLKNAGATYQRLVNRMFQKKIYTQWEFIEIKVHLYFKSQRVTIKGVLDYIIRDIQYKQFPQNTRYKQFPRYIQNKQFLQ